MESRLDQFLALPGHHHVIDRLCRQTVPCLQLGNMYATCAISLLRKDRICKYILCFLKWSAAWQGVTVTLLYHNMGSNTGPRLNIKTVFPGMGISIIKIKGSWDNLIFIIGIHMETFFYIVTPLWTPKWIDSLIASALFRNSRSMPYWTNVSVLVIMLGINPKYLICWQRSYYVTRMLWSGFSHCHLML